MNNVSLKVGAWVDGKAQSLHLTWERSCPVISVKTIVNLVPLKKSYLATLNQYLKNVLNGHSIQFLKLSVQNIEGNITSAAARFQVRKTGTRDTCSFKEFVKANFLNYTYESTFF